MVPSLPCDSSRIDMNDRDFGDYFREKINKLQRISESIRDESLLSTIFQKCYFFINGVTDPPIDELRRLLRLHGGICENYYVSRVTHSICNFFTESQVKQYNEKTHLFADKSRVFHVTVKWVLESIQAKKRLPERLYPPRGINLKTNGFLLDNYFNKSNKEMSDENTNDKVTSPQLLIQPELSESPSVGLKSNSSTLIKTAVADILGERKNILSSNISLHPQSISSSVIDGNGNNVTTLTSEHPDFLCQYFQRSRLSFIGRWKNRLPSLLKHLNASITDLSAVPKLSNINEELNSSSSSGPCSFSRSLGPIMSPRVVIHVDMDCFFVSALIRNRPDLQTIPVAVAHSSNAGSSEISSCNYPARAKGIKNGMFMSAARDLCPELVILPYDFKLYEELCGIIYSILYTSSALMVEPVSVDEAYLEYPCNTDGMKIASDIRERIQKMTGGCTASAGIGSNMLLARLATKKAKPNGQYSLCFPPPCNVQRNSLSPNNREEEQEEDNNHYHEHEHEHDLHDRMNPQISNVLANLPVSEFPGIGYKISSKLEEKGLRIGMDVWKYSKSTLQEVFGFSLGKKLWDSSRGIDHRQLSRLEPPKSIGAEVNWGLRFNEKAKAEDFLHQIAVETSSRLNDAEIKGRNIVVKLMKKRAGSTEPKKFLGHGLCDSVSKSITLHRSTSSSEDLYQAALPLFRELTRNVPVVELRGMGISIGKLEGNVICKDKSILEREFDFVSSSVNVRKPTLSSHHVQKDSEFAITESKFRDTSNTGCRSAEPIDQCVGLMKNEKKMIRNVTSDVRCDGATRDTAIDLEDSQSVVEVVPPPRRARVDSHLRADATTRSRTGRQSKPRAVPVVRYGPSSSAADSRARGSKRLDGETVSALHTRGRDATGETCFRVENLSTLRAGIEAWLRGDCPPEGGDLEYLAKYGEWLVERGALDAAATYVRLVTRVVTRILAEIPAMKRRAICEFSDVIANQWAKEDILVNRSEGEKNDIVLTGYNIEVGLIEEWNKVVLIVTNRIQNKVLELYGAKLEF